MKLTTELNSVPVADVALEGFGARVDALVAGQLRRPREGLLAVRALVGVLPAGRDCSRLNSCCVTVNPVKF